MCRGTGVHQAVAAAAAAVSSAAAAALEGGSMHVPLAGGAGRATTSAMLGCTVPADGAATREHWQQRRHSRCCLPMSTEVRPQKLHVELRPAGPNPGAHARTASLAPPLNRREWEGRPPSPEECLQITPVARPSSDPACDWRRGSGQARVGVCGKVSVPDRPRPASPPLGPLWHALAAPSRQER